MEKRIFGLIIVAAVSLFFGFTAGTIGVSCRMENFWKANAVNKGHAVWVYETNSSGQLFVKGWKWKIAPTNE